jgi:hypothetical protein
MRYQFKAYLKFLWNSKNEHAVHSPFVFLLVTKCFYDKKTKDFYLVLKNFFQFLIKSNDEVAIPSRKKIALLYRVTSYFEIEKSLILDFSGVYVMALAAGNPKGALLVLEDNPEKTIRIKKQLEQTNFLNIKYSGSWNANINTSETKIFQLIFFNEKQNLLENFEAFLPTITNTTVWIFEGIHTSAEKDFLWQTIKRHDKVTVTIDVFYWGFVFFRKEQAKEHFVIRV